MYSICLFLRNMIIQTNKEMKKQDRKRKGNKKANHAKLWKKYNTLIAKANVIIITIVQKYKYNPLKTKTFNKSYIVYNELL